MRIRQKPAAIRTEKKKMLPAPGVKILLVSLKVEV